MSELINNRQERQKILKELILELHNKYMEGLTSNESLLEKFSKLLEIDKHYSRRHCRRKKIS